MTSQNKFFANLFYVEQKGLFVLDDPNAFLHIHLLGKVVVYDGRLPPDAHPQMLLLNFHHNVLPLYAARGASYGTIR